MRILTAFTAAVGIAALAACQQSAEEQVAENIEENAEAEAENILEAAENRAENIVESAENQAENLLNEADDTGNAADTNTTNSY